MPAPVITLSHVSKVYSNGTVALQDMNMTIQEGQFVSLVGPSGCGKSTVLRLVAGLGNMTAGSIEWGQALENSPPNRQGDHKLAFVFQEPALMPWATVMDNVRLPLKLAGEPKQKADQDVLEALQLVSLRGFERSFPRELSGGMRMRVSIARALVTKPQVLLMDEPFGALDEITRSKLNSDVLELWQAKRWTVIFVTHNIYEAVYLSNRVVVMAARPGRVVADIPIDAPYPRSEEFRTSPLYNDYCREVSARLHEAMHGNAQDHHLRPLSAGRSR
ncbi:MAG: ABC transporter ATP-binding protein [Thermostichus sp. BF3_bins_97]